MADKKTDKSDLTSIHQLVKKKPGSTSDATSSGQSELIDSPIDSFDSLTDLGLVDHEVTAVSPPPPDSVPSFKELETKTEFIAQTEISSTPPYETPPFEAPPLEAPPPEPVHPTLESIRDYSESTMGTAFTQSTSVETPIFYPFNFYAEGPCGFFERDKFLRFITENPIGITSSEMDLQIQAGRIFLPRISEFAGIKLIQEMRDSPLKFKLEPSSTEGDEFRETTEPLTVQFEASPTPKPVKSAVLVVDLKSDTAKLYQTFDSLQISQFLKAEMVEAEKSDLFQEVLARMAESLKNKARLKGADAVSIPQTQIVPLRLPSQYQIVMTASLLKRNPS